MSDRYCFEFSIRQEGCTSRISCSQFDCASMSVEVEQESKAIACLEALATKYLD